MTYLRKVEIKIAISTVCIVYIVMMFHFIHIKAIQVFFITMARLSKGNTFINKCIYIKTCWHGNIHCYVLFYHLLVFQTVYIYLNLIN